MAAPTGRGRGRWKHHHLPRLRAAVWEAEELLLSVVKTPLTKSHVHLDDHRTVRTISTPARGDSTPILLIHGLCSGSAIFALNIDSLAQHRQVFAIDLPGFGHSFRFKVAENAEKVEWQYVQFLEEWRRKMGIGRFILLGHSMGGYLCCAYALKYPGTVAHLVLDDPWGFSGTRKLWEKLGKMKLTGTPVLYRRMWRKLALLFNKDADLESTSALDVKKDGLGKVLMDYLQRLNDFKPISGERAFSRLSMLYGLRARQPMLPRLSTLDSRVKLSFLIAERSFVSSTYKEELENECKMHHLDVHLIENSNHDIHITQSDNFNAIVNQIGQLVDAT